MRRLFLLVGLAALVFNGCFGPDPNVTEGGKGKPEVELVFPDTAPPGSVQTAELTITNPGPGDMRSLVVAFSRLGDPKLPVPIVDVTARGGEGAVDDVEPQPNAVSRDGVVYTFDGVPEGDSVTFTFRLQMPVSRGLAGNAILVYDGQDPDRARGVRLEVEVGG